MKLMILGHARHGKDTACSILHDEFGLSFVSSSYFVAEKAVRPWLEKLGITYNSLDACYTDRVNHRSDWFNAIAAYNHKDPARLARELYAEYDIYCGLRSIEEFQAAEDENLFDVAFWVDAWPRVEDEPATSITVKRSCANFVIQNTTDEKDLKDRVINSYLHAQKVTGLK